MSARGGGGRRRRGRELALRAMFELEGSDKDALAVLAYQGEEVGATADVSDFARHLVIGCLSRRDEVDATISAVSRWPLTELGKVERAILRISVLELLEPDATPVPVVVDEALELTRTYAGDDAVQYVNGVLGQVARQRV